MDFIYLLVLSSCKFVGDNEGLILSTLFYSREEKQILLLMDIGKFTELILHVYVYIYISHLFLFFQLYIRYITNTDKG